MHIPPIPYFAPSGTPVGILDIAALISSIITKEDRIEELADAIRARFGIKHCFFVSTGRAAMVTLLGAVKEISGEPRRNRVILPSYTCYSVPASVARADLRVDIADIDHETLNYSAPELNSIDTDSCLAAISANLYGIPDDLPALEKFARDRGLYLIDDAAQCMGGSIGNRYSGTFGDAGLYSLDKGKNITSIQGGIIVTSNDEIAECLHNRLSNLQAQSTKATLLDSIKLVIYSIFLHPSLYWIPASSPSLELGKTVYTTEYPIEGYGKALSTVAYRLFRRLSTINQARIDNARYLIEGLKDIPFIRLQKIILGCNPVYLRLPIFIDDTDVKDHLLTKLNNAGISATASYPESIADLDEVRDLTTLEKREFNGGQRVAKSIVTLPTHPYMTRKALDNIVNIAAAL